MVSFQIALTESPSFLSIVVVHPCRVYSPVPLWPHVDWWPVNFWLFRAKSWWSHLIDLSVQLNGEGYQLQLSGVFLLFWKCTGWFRSNCLEKKVQDSACITLTHLWYYTKNCSHKASWARLQRSRALMFQQISMQSGVLSKVCQSLKESLH